MRLNTLWHEGTWRDIAFAAIHCAGGDVLIATASLLGALVAVGTGYWPHGMVFLAAVVVAIRLIGAAVSGSTIIAATSALVLTGAVTFWHPLLWAVLGAVVGEVASYVLGNRYKRHIFERWPFRRYLQLAARSEKFFVRHGGKSVVFGRFTPALRPFVPLFAGSLAMIVAHVQRLAHRCRSRSLPRVPASRGVFA